MHDWVCPHCDKAQVIAASSTQSGHVHIELPVAEGNVGFNYNAIRCSNPKCKSLTFGIMIAEDYRLSQNHYTMLPGGRTLYLSQLLPTGKFKPQPNCIPRVLLEDYQEACAIKDLSPKASATLARRCLQGMIRDFAGIAKSRLIDEISALREAVDEGRAAQGITMDSVEAIDHVRRVGNIGAHMGKDIDLIVPVDPGEAQALIELIEMLFAEWYVARAQRQERLAKIAKIGADKDSARKSLIAPVLPTTNAGGASRSVSPPEQALAAASPPEHEPEPPE